MTKTLPITEARYELPNLPKEFDRDPEVGAVAVTNRGKPVLAVMPWERYESIVETLEIMGDRDLMAALKKSIQEMKSGKTYGMEEVKRDIGL